MNQTTLIIVAMVVASIAFLLVQIGIKLERRSWLRIADEVFAKRQAAYEERGETYRVTPICKTCGFALPQKPVEERSPWFPTPAFDKLVHPPKRGTNSRGPG